MLKKKPFERSVTRYNTKTDLNLPVEHLFEMWADPSSRVVFSLLDVVSTSEEKLNKMSDVDKAKLDDEFWWCVSQVFIDCDIEGLDFSSPEKSKESFESPYISWGFLFDVLVSYITRLLSENETIKKKVNHLIQAVSSGNRKGQKESE